jgi:hypothetical protein
MGAWNTQNNHVIKREIEHTIRRKMIDVATFKLSFFDDGPSELIENALQDKTVIGEYVENHAEYKVPGRSEPVKYYDCRAIFYNLLTVHTVHSHARTIWLKSFGIILSLLWSQLPGLTRLLTGLNYCGHKWNEILCFFLISLSFFLLFFLGFEFFRRTYLDLDRIQHLNEQLAQMISPTKIPNVFSKFMPTINLADPISLQSWLNLRRTAYDYGINFTNRSKIFVTMCYLFAISSWFLIYFPAVLFKNTLHDETTMGMLVLLYIMIIYGAFTIALAFKLFRINECYYMHISLIRDNQQMYQGMHHLRDYYIKSNKDKEIPFDINEIFNTNPRSTPHRQLTDWIMIILGKDHKFEQFCDPLVEKLVEMMNELARDIKKHFKYHATTLFGMRVNFAVLGLTFVFYFILIVTAYLKAIEDRRPIYRSS